MSTLKSLDIENFQSLEKSRIEFAPGLNVIVGPSNLGKSASVRALKALVRNAAAPGLVRHGSKAFKLTATFSDGTTEELHKGKGVNTYTINYPDKDEIVNSKSGVKAPDEVTELWAMPAPDGREISIANQHDPPFLLTEPASSVAKVLGDLTNASVLMEAVQRVNKKRTDAIADEKARLRELEEVKELIAQHGDFKARSRAVAKARETYEETLRIISKYEIIKDLVETKDQIDFENMRLVHQQISLTDAIDNFNHGEKHYETVVALASLLAEYENVERELGILAASKASLLYLVDEAEKEIHDLLKQNEQCPLCGSIIC